MEPIRPLLRPRLRDRVEAVLEFARPSKLIAAAVSTIVVAAGCWWLLRAPAPAVEATLPRATVASTAAQRPPDPSSPESLGLPPGSSPDTATPVAPTPTIVVQIAGAVQRPGVYRVELGARVNDLVLLAGGATDEGDPDAVSLAVVVIDGERIYVPRVGESPPSTTRPSASNRSTVVASPGEEHAPLDLNEATAAELDALPGVGPATAAAIVAHRDSSGPFGSVDDLLDVRGIGPAKLDAIRALVTT